MAKIETRAIKGAESSVEHPRPVSSPIYLSTTYWRNEDGSYNEDLVYTRESNPNRRTLERCIADLEGGQMAFAFSSGMAAITSVFQALDPEDEVLIPDDIYFSVTKYLTEIQGRWGLKFKTLDMSDLGSLEKAIGPKTRLIWLETPSNPQLKISDIATIAEIARKKSVMLAVDNTWPTPVLQRPISLGADIVMHSSTKYMGGHSDVLGGAVAFAKENLYSERVANIQKLGGAVPSPFDCWLVSRGIQTLPVRMKAHCENAARLAEWFDGHPKIEKVLYPGIESHKGHEIAKNQMIGGYGGMISILIKENVKKILEISNVLQYFTPATSLGGVESLVEHRHSIEKPKSMAPENLLRISVGLENIDDLIQDWESALRA